MMTGYGVERLVREAVENGALGVLHNPFSAAELIETVERTRAPMPATSRSWSRGCW